VFSAVALVAVVALQPHRRTPIAPEHRLRVLGCGLAGSAGFHLFFSWGQARTSVAVSAIVLSMMPALVAIGERVFLAHRLTVRQVVGLVLCIGGVLVIALVTAGGGGDATSSSASAATSFAGIAAIAGAAIVWSGQIVATRSIAHRYDPFWLNTPGTVVGAAVCLIVAAPGLDDYRDLSASSWLLVVWLGAVSSALIYAILALAMQSLSATTTTSLGTLVTPLSIVVGWIALGDRPSLVTAIGGLIAVMGVGLVTLGTTLTPSSQGDPVTTTST
jgi:drug/metabolite transporter, DME family